MDIQLDTRNKIVKDFSNPRWLSGVKGLKLTKFDPTYLILARHRDSVISDSDKNNHEHTNLL